jgi:hypothetical protein
MAIGRIPEPGTGIPESIIAAKGDILTGTANDTPAVLTVGTNGHTLVADSAEATGLKWEAVSSGGMTLLSTTSLTGATTTISSINQTYTDLIVILSGVTGSTNGSDFLCAPNGTTTIVYQVNEARFGTTNYPSGVSGGRMDFTNGSGHNNTNANNSWALTISQYAATNKRKAFEFTGVFPSNQAGGPLCQIMAGGGIDTNTAISSLVFSMSGGNLSTGTVLVYGVK